MARIGRDSKERQAAKAALEVKEANEKKQKMALQANVQVAASQRSNKVARRVDTREEEEEDRTHLRVLEEDEEEEEDDEPRAGAAAAAAAKPVATSTGGSKQRKKPQPREQRFDSPNGKSLNEIVGSSDEALVGGLNQGIAAVSQVLDNNSKREIESRMMLVETGRTMMESYSKAMAAVEEAKQKGETERRQMELDFQFKMKKLELEELRKNNGA